MALSQLLMRLEKWHNLQLLKIGVKEKRTRSPTQTRRRRTPTWRRCRQRTRPPEAVGQDTSGSSAEEQRWKVSANETAAGTQKQSGSDDAAQAVSGDEDATAAMPPPSSTTAQKVKCTSNETETQLPSAQKVVGPAAQTHMATSIDVLPVSARTHSYVVDPHGESPMDYEVFQYEEE